MIIDIDKYDAMEQQLTLISDIAYDYDGMGNSMEGMKTLIDRLREYAKMGLRGERVKLISAKNALRMDGWFDKGP